MSAAGRRLVIRIATKRTPYDLVELPAMAAELVELPSMAAELVELPSMAAELVEMTSNRLEVFGLTSRPADQQGIECKLTGREGSTRPPLPVKWPQETRPVLQRIAPR